MSPTASIAHVVLPAMNFAEKDGTYTNRKGRVQRVRPALVPPPELLPDHQIFNLLLAQTGQSSSAENPEQIFQSIATEITAYRDLSHEKIGESGVQVH